MPWGFVAGVAPDAELVVAKVADSCARTRNLQGDSGASR